MSVRVHVTDHFPTVVKTAEGKTAAAIAKAAADVEAQAKAAAPVDTGNLKSSIQAHKDSELAWNVTAHAEYAVYVELGTSKMPARPFLIPALEYVRGTLKAALRRIV